MEEDDEASSAANSEIRYIALELMKLAQQAGRKFEDVAAEYIGNAEKLSQMIAGENATAVRKARRASSKNR